MRQGAKGRIATETVELKSLSESATCLNERNRICARGWKLLLSRVGL